MRIPPRLILMALPLTFVEAAYADTVSLYTAPMNVSAPFALDCLIVNVSDQTRTVTIRPNGVPGTPVELAPGGTAGTHVSGGCTDGGCPMYCVFTVQGGRPNFRAAACEVDTADTVLACLPAE